MSRSIGALAALALLIVSAGCAAPNPSSSASPTVPATPGEIVGEPVRLETLELAADHRTLTLHFIGAGPYVPGDFCSADYLAKTQVVGDQLQVGVYRLRNPTPVPSGVGCLAVGHRRELVVTLDEPFDGILAHDLSGQMFFLAPPPGLAQITGLPPGWELVSQGNWPGPVPGWHRVWSPTPGWTPGAGSSVVLIQVFGGPLGGEPEENVEPVTVNGWVALMSVYAPTGDVTITWGLGGDGMALDGNLRDFSKAEFVALANSVVHVAP